MPIQFACPTCNKPLQVPDDNAGANVRCPVCQAIFQVPFQQAEPATLVQDAQRLSLSNCYYRNRQNTWGPFSSPEINNLAAAGLLLPDDPMWSEEGDSRQAIEARTVLDFSSLQLVAVPAPDWLDDMQEERGPIPNCGTQPIPDWLEDLGRWESLQSPPSKQSSETSGSSSVASNQKAVLFTEAKPPESPPIPPPYQQADKSAQTPTMAPPPVSVRPAAKPDATSATVEVAKAKKSQIAPAVEALAPPIIEAKRVTPAIQSAVIASPAPETKQDTAPIPSRGDNCLSPATAEVHKEPVRKTTLSPNAGTDARETVIRLMGFDPQTGQILDSGLFRKWRKEQEQHAVPQAAKPIGEVFSEARRTLEQWVDADANRELILKGDLSVIRRESTLQEHLKRYSNYGPEMLEKLWHYLEFTVENRKKFLASYPQGK